MQGPENSEPVLTPEQGPIPILSVGNMIAMPEHNGGKPVVIVGIDDDGTNDFSIVVSIDKEGLTYSGMGTAHADQIGPNTTFIRHLSPEELIHVLATALSNGKTPTDDTIELARASIKSQT